MRSIDFKLKNPKKNSENMSDEIAGRIKNDYIGAIGRAIKNIEENL